MNITNVQHFDETNSFALGAPLGTTQVIYTIAVPSKCILRIKSFANYTDTPAAVGGGLTWSIRRNGIPVSRYGLIVDIIGQSFKPETIFTDVLKGGDVLSIITINNSGLAIQSGARIVFDLEGVR